MTNQTCKHKIESDGGWGGNGFGNSVVSLPCGAPTVGDESLCEKHQAKATAKRLGALRAEHVEYEARGWVHADDPDAARLCPKCVAVSA